MILGKESAQDVARALGSVAQAAPRVLFGSRLHSCWSRAGRGLLECSSSESAAVRCGTSITTRAGMIDSELPELARSQPVGTPEARDFRASFRRIVKDGIIPALRRYQLFLIEEYLPRARPTAFICADGASSRSATRSGGVAAP